MAVAPPHGPALAVVLAVDEIMRTYRSLPTRPSIEEVEAAEAVIRGAEAEEQARLDELARREKPPDLPDELFFVLQEVRRGAVRLLAEEQRREALRVVDLDNRFRVLGELIQRASRLVSPDGDGGGGGVEEEAPPVALGLGVASGRAEKKVGFGDPSPRLITSGKDPPPMASTCLEEPAYNWLAKLKAFDETKAGVKGLLDAGVTSIPRIFVSPPEERAAIRGHAPITTPLQVPIIDLQSAAADGEPLQQAVEQIRVACETWGFFQVIGHGVPPRVLDETLARARRFHEGDNGEKGAFYSRDPHRKVAFSSSFNLYKARATDWRDTLLVYTAPDPATPDELPEACREIIPE